MRAFSWVKVETLTANVKATVLWRGGYGTALDTLLVIAGCDLSGLAAHENRLTSDQRDRYGSKGALGQSSNSHGARGILSNVLTRSAMRALSR